MTLFHQLTPTEATHVTSPDLINQGDCHVVTTLTLQRTGHRRMQPGTGRMQAGLLTGRQAAAGGSTCIAVHTKLIADRDATHLALRPLDVTRRGTRPYAPIEADRVVPVLSPHPPVANIPSDPTPFIRNKHEYTNPTH